MQQIKQRALTDDRSGRMNGSKMAKKVDNRSKITHGALEKNQKSQNDKRVEAADKLENDKKSSGSSLVSGFAVFGDSIWALVLSFVLLLVAIGVAFYLDRDETTARNPVDEAYNKLPPTPKIPPAKIYHFISGEGPFVTNEMRLAYENDGVIAVRGLLTSEQLEMLKIASDQVVLASETPEERSRKKRRSERQFHTVQSGAIFLEAPGTDNATTFGFREVALFSNIPKMAAELLQLDSSKNETMRMLRDIFLAKDSEQFVCGWHVDDTGFWPAVAEAPGVNAWIAVDDMPVYGGGGFALAVGSHKTSWRQDAHEAIGSPVTYPSGGFKDVEDLFNSRVGGGTCNLKREAPHLNKRMEETKRIYEVRSGDVIFTHRWLFHRTVPFNRRKIEAREAAGEPEPIFRRYSLRYNPGSAQIPRGYGTELSVLWDETNGGRTADEVAERDAPWYPRCFPSPSDDEMKQLNSLINEKIPVAQERLKARKQEMKPYLTKRQKRPASTTGY